MLFYFRFDWIVASFLLFTIPGGVISEHVWDLDLDYSSSQVGLGLGLGLEVRVRVRGWIRHVRG